MHKFVSCDQCSTRAVVTLKTKGGGLLSFCGHHNRKVYGRLDAFDQAFAPTNHPSDRAISEAVDTFLVSAVGHCEVTA